jgi:hypothetical protein
MTPHLAAVEALPLHVGMCGMEVNPSPNASASLALGLSQGVRATPGLAVPLGGWLSCKGRRHNCDAQILRYDGVKFNTLRFLEVCTYAAQTAARTLLLHAGCCCTRRWQRWHAGMRAPTLLA